MTKLYRWAIEYKEREFMVDVLTSTLQRAKALAWTKIEGIEELTGGLKQALIDGVTNQYPYIQSDESVVIG